MMKFSLIFKESQLLNKRNHKCQNTNKIVILQKFHMFLDILVLELIIVHKVTEILAI
jgi:hypothetical protein